jgi:hypothetical protein
MDLAMFIIIMEMCIGFLTAPNLGLFTKEQIGYVNVDAASNQYVVQYQSNDSFNTLVAKPANVNLLTFAMDWVIAGWTMFLSIVGAFVLISWTLYWTFHLPMEICIFTQGIVYLIYTWGFIQWRSGRGGRYFE